MSDRYADWDGAYVLGALTAPERREFEEHLAGCVGCSAAVEEISAIPGVLAAVSRDEALSTVADMAPLAEEAPPRLNTGPEAEALPESLLPRLLDEVRRRRRRRRILEVFSVVGAAAAAAAIVVAVVVPNGADQQVQQAAPPSPVPTAPGVPPAGVAAPAPITLSAVQPSPLTAHITLASEPWGTSIRMVCDYARSAPGAAPAPDYAGADAYALDVIDKDGNALEIATWTAAPGSKVFPSASTTMSRDSIWQVQVRMASTQAVLLQADV